MPNYRRAFIPGGTWFFTVNLLERKINDLLIREIDFLREHVDYLHINPVKHGHVARAFDWPFSSFHLYVEKGVLSAKLGRRFEFGGGRR